MRFHALLLLAVLCLLLPPVQVLDAKPRPPADVGIYSTQAVNAPLCAGFRLKSGLVNAMGYYLAVLARRDKRSARQWGRLSVAIEAALFGTVAHTLGWPAAMVFAITWDAAELAAYGAVSFRFDRNPWPDLVDTVVSKTIRRAPYLLLPAVRAYMDGALILPWLAAWGFHWSVDEWLWRDLEDAHIAYGLRKKWKDVTRQAAGLTRKPSEQKASDGVPQQAVRRAVTDLERFRFFFFIVTLAASLHLALPDALARPSTVTIPELLLVVGVALSSQWLLHFFTHVFTSQPMRSLPEQLGELFLVPALNSDWRPRRSA